MTGMPDGGATVYTTVGDEEAAHRLARALVDERLAACVNILGPASSVYRWEGVVEEEREWILLVKTRRSLVTRLRARFADLHPYSLPAFVVLGWQDVSPEYGAWVLAETAADADGSK